MADKKKDETHKPDATPATPAKRGVPLKAIGVVAAIMIAEGAGVFLLVGVLGPKPQEAAAVVHGDDHADADATVEIELADDRFQNMQSGRVWSWEIGIVLKVKRKNEEYVGAQLREREAEITEGISQIIRRAQHVHLKEPELTTLIRQIKGFLDKSLGVDGEGASRIERVMIPKCKGIQLEG